MLPAKIDPSAEFHYFLRDERTGFHLLLVDRDLVAHNPFTPLWVATCVDLATLNALSRWITVRREQWQDWGRLAHAIGADAFDTHMRRLIDAEPPEHVVGHVVQQREDREVAFGEQLDGPRGLRSEILYIHRFASEELHRRFTKWLNRGRNIYAVEALVLLAFERGTDALAAELEAIASRQPPKRSRGPARRRDVRKAA